MKKIADERRPAGNLCKIRFGILLLVVLTIFAASPFESYAAAPDRQYPHHLAASPVKDICNILLDAAAIENNVTCIRLTESREAYITQNDAAMHKSHTGTSEVIEYLRVNKNVIIIGETSDGRWAQVFNGSRMGYVRYDFISDKPVYGFTAIGTTPEIENYAMAYLQEHISPEVWNIFCSDGWELCFTTEDIEATYLEVSGRTDTVYGLAAHGTKTIYVSARSEARIDIALVHEMGHYIYHKLSDGDSAAFSTLYRSYLAGSDDCGYGIHCTSSASEFFAESYSKYILNETIPESIRGFMESVLSSLF